MSLKKEEGGGDLESPFKIVNVVRGRVKFAEGKNGRSPRGGSVTRTGEDLQSEGRRHYQANFNTQTKVGSCRGNGRASGRKGKRSEG